MVLTLRKEASRAPATPAQRVSSQRRTAAHRRYLTATPRPRLPPPSLAAPRPRAIPVPSRHLTATLRGKLTATTAPSATTQRTRLWQQLPPPSLAPPLPRAIPVPKVTVRRLTAPLWQRAKLLPRATPASRVTRRRRTAAL